MADIELIIKIDEEDYKIMKHNIVVNNPLCPLSQEEIVSKIAKGIPLPEGHEKLINADKFLSYLIFSKHIDSLTCGEVKEAIKMCKVIEDVESVEDLSSINDISLADYVKENYIDKKCI